MKLWQVLKSQVDALTNKDTCLGTTFPHTLLSEYFH